MYLERIKMDHLLLEKNDCYRFSAINDETTEDAYRTPYRRDYARIIHSASFRRLEHKTQLFPGGESDFFRNRLTHSMEVAQISKTIALKLLNEHPGLDVNPDICEIAGLIHDLGHPPFGHTGEKALDECMKEFGGFEGNAQTIRIITRLEKKENNCDYRITPDGIDNRIGLSLTARAIASGLKYDKMIPLKRGTNKLEKGYYESEKNIIDKVKKCLLPNATIKKFKTIECSIMDLADDIAYSTYDIEDAFKAGFLTPLDFICADDNVLDEIVNKLKANGIKCTRDKCRTILLTFFISLWDEPLSKLNSINKRSKRYKEKAMTQVSNIYLSSKTLAADGYSRTVFTSEMIHHFIKGIVTEINHTYPILSSVKFDENTNLLVNILKHFTYVTQINSSRLKIVEHRGYEIVQKIFEKLSKEDGKYFLPDDFRKSYEIFAKDNAYAPDKNRLISDFIAGMTDRYAVEFYGRLYSENPQSIFKPF